MKTLFRLLDHKVKAAYFPEIVLTIYLSTQQKIPSDLNLLLKGCLKLSLKCNDSYEHVL